MDVRVNLRRRWAALMLASGVMVGLPACFQRLVDLGVGTYLGDEQQFGTDPGPPKYDAKAFVNWETPHVSPLAMTPDRSKLLAVNTPDNSLWIFDLTAGPVPASLGAIPVGLDPVSVRARTNNEVWVVNQLSDSVSIVDLTRGNTVRTLHPGDEPTDVAFANDRAFVVCSQFNRVAVYELSDLAAAPREIEIEGKSPRAIAVSPDGRRVYVAIFESGNNTSIVPFNSVVAPDGPYGGQNPPPNSGSGFSPPMNPDLPQQAPLSQIVKKDLATGRWLDDNGGDWSAKITWDLHDHDLAVIDTATLDVTYVPHLMNLNMHLATLGDGRVAVVGTEAENHIRFEPNVTGRFVHSVIAFVDPLDPPGAEIADLNPHLGSAYASKIGTIPPEERAASVADPAGVVFTADGQTGYVSGLDSNNVIMIDAVGNRLDRIDVGQGPTGLCLDEPRGRLYVYEKFDAAIRIIDTATLSSSSRLGLTDPTPQAVRDGRPMLYDAHLTSGLGVTSCASCHVDGRTDQLSWDLGNPSGDLKKFNQYCDNMLEPEPAAHCLDFHPVKGPMLTQPLQDIIGLEPLHWRGDRENLAAFKPAFVSLLGNDREPTDDEMAKFEAFLATIVYPPNPHRNPDNTLKTEVGDGNPQRGEELFKRHTIDDPNGSQATNENPLVQGLLRNAGAILSCNRCHQLPEGTNQRITSNRELNLPQGMKVPQLRTAYQRTGFSKTSQSNNRGFGYSHDGSFDSLDEFLHLPNFHFGSGDLGDQNRADVIAFVMSMGTDTHAGVGMQVTLAGADNEDAAALDRLDLMLRIADSGDVGLVVQGMRAGERRGYIYVGGGTFESDRGERIAAETLRSASSVDDAITWTVVPLGSERRIGLGQ